MTMKAAIGFESGTLIEDANLTTPWTLNPPVCSTTYKRQGSYSAKIQCNSGSIYVVNLSLSCTALAEYYFQFSLYLDASAFAGTNPLLTWMKDATILGGIRPNLSTGLLEVYVGNFATLVGSVSCLFGTWQVFEVHVKIDASTGVIQVRRDMGSLNVNFSGNTKPGSDTAINVFRISNLFLNQTYMYVDDIILNDTAGSLNNSWPGGSRIIRLAPTGDVGSPQFTPTPSGAHWSTVDEVPPSATDNLIAATAGLVDEMGLSDCPADVASVAAVMPMMFGLKGSSNPPTKVGLGLKIGGAPYYTSDLALPVSQGVAREIWEVSPATGQPFGVAELNGANFLLKSVA